MWRRVTQNTDFQEETARLSSLRLSTAADGSLQGLHVAFHALSEQGRNAAYFADVDAGGDLRWRQQAMEQGGFAYPAHPADILAALDEVELADVAAAKGGMTLRADSQAGDIAYRNEYLDLYLLKNGRRQPIQEIVFHSDSPWMTTTVCPEATEDEDDAGVTRTDSSLVVTESVTLGESDCELWFLEQAVAKAEVVEFVED